MHELSHNTKTYLKKFQKILDEMIQEMQCAPLGDSISCNFIIQMIPHHRAAIQMSENLLQYTTNIPLQEMARQIIAEQTKSIGNMERIKCQCAQMKNCSDVLQDYQRRMQHIKQRMFEQMEHAKENNDININFIREMIPHHEGAVEMSKWTLAQCICPGLKPILESIICSQEKGIARMKTLLKELEC